jgi:predicted SAM-dependent methyltransferase
MISFHLLQLWYNKLKPNGILRLAVPDFEMYTNLYKSGKLELDQFLGPLYGKWEMAENKTIYHKTTYDYKSLTKILDNNKFKHIRLWNWREVEHGKYDDYSQAYIPHMEKEKGHLMSLNIECKK